MSTESPSLSSPTEVVKLEKIVSVSSEDPQFPASNLLKKELSKKWKSQRAGEKECAVVFQLTKPSKIVSIDVGNCFSAMLQVLVANSSMPDDYRVCLPNSSLMSFKESKSISNGEKIEFFRQDLFLDEAASGKWDRIKVICSQPYNSTLQYGLAFIVFHAEKEPEKKAAPSPGLGIFKLKTESSNDLLRPGGIFAHRSEISERQLKGAAAIRAASLPENVVRTQVKFKHKPEEQKRLGSPSPHTVPKKPKVAPLAPSQPRPSPSPSSSSRVVEENTKTPQRTKPPLDDPQTSRPKRKEKPFGKLFEGVIVVISGFQNPLRGNIRAKVMEMGAKYKADWDGTCTHLICAFTNTPKFRQVQGKGKIVKKEWIEESYAKRRRLPWRRFALSKTDQTQRESEEEILEEIKEAKPPRPDHRKRLHSTGSEGENTDDEIERVRANIRMLEATPPSNKPEDPPSASQSTATTRETRTSPRKAKQAKTAPTPTKLTPKKASDRSANGKEDGIKILLHRRPFQPNAAKMKGDPSESDDEPYDADTDSESGSSHDSLPPLPKLFEGQRFYLASTLGDKDRALLGRYIVGHSGSIAPKVPGANWVISEDSEGFREFSSDIKIVRPEWIWRSHDEAKTLPCGPFEVPKR